MMDENGNVVYWLPEYSRMKRFNDRNPAGYPIKYFNRVLLPAWLRLRGAI